MRGKKRFIKLSGSEREALELGRKKGKKSTFRQRSHYILLSDQGKTIVEIAEIYQVVRQSVSKWFDRYEKQGIAGLHTAKGKGRPAIVRIDNETEMTQIERLVEQSPQNLKPVLRAIDKKLGKKMSKKTLQRLLKKRLELETLSQDSAQRT
jgi:transposase